MPLDQQLINALGTAVTTSVSFNVLIITFLLGEYVSLDRQKATSRVKEPYGKTAKVLLVVLWIGAISLIALLLGIDNSISVFIKISLGLFLLQLIVLIGGLSYFSLQYL